MPLERLRYIGWSVKCPICGGRFRSFAPDVWDGATWRGERVRCPRCGSRPRHRWLWLYVAGQQLVAGKSLLHLAPEPMLTSRLAAQAAEYVSADIEPERGSVQADLTALPFEDERFEVVICSHVLEHVPDDGAAMREMHRVLSLGGTALIQTPVNYEQQTTYEDPSATDEADRLQRFSQADHVRVFGQDLGERLGAAGFGVRVEDAATLGASAVERYGLRPNAWPLRNDIYVCVRDG